MPADGFYRGSCFLIVSKRTYGGYSSNELLVRVASHYPTKLEPGEYVLPLRLRVHEKCLTRVAGWNEVQANAPPDATAERAT